MMGMIDFDLLADGCSLEQITRARPDYAQFQERCGSRSFHAYREIAGLASASADERFEVLSRLAEFPEFVYFRTLVEQHEPDADQARRLIESRYADVIASGCENRPPAEYEIDSSNMDQIIELRTFRLRWYEYCSNR